MPLKGQVPERDLFKLPMLDAAGESCLAVFKNGAKTGTTIGNVNIASSITHTYSLRRDLRRPHLLYREAQPDPLGGYPKVIYRGIFEILSPGTSVKWIRLASFSSCLSSDWLLIKMEGLWLVDSVIGFVWFLFFSFSFTR